MARRLVFVAQNALRNGDLQRANSVLQDLQDAMSSDNTRGDATVHARR
jgi:hypothetical protein